MHQHHCLVVQCFVVCFSFLLAVTGTSIVGVFFKEVASQAKEWLFNKEVSDDISAYFTNHKETDPERLSALKWMGRSYVFFPLHIHLMLETRVDQ